MQKQYTHYLKVIAIALLLPCLDGCQISGDGGNASSDGFVSGLSAETTTTGGGLARIHNPEPATMFLLGSGMAAMKLIRRRKYNQNKKT